MPSWPCRDLKRCCCHCDHKIGTLPKLFYKSAKCSYNLGPAVTTLCDEHTAEDLDSLLGSRLRPLLKLWLQSNYDARSGHAAFCPDMISCLRARVRRGDYKLYWYTQCFHPVPLNAWLSIAISTNSFSLTPHLFYSAYRRTSWEAMCESPDLSVLQATVEEMSVNMPASVCSSVTEEAMLTRQHQLLWLSLSML